MAERCQCLEGNNHQGWFGECFIQVLAAAAGLQCTKLTPDCSGVDFEIAHPGDQDYVHYPEIKVQVKSWSTPRRAQEDPSCWRYPRLSQKRFNALAGRHRVPRFLFLVMVPPESERYAIATADALILSHAAYWVSLEDHARIPEPECEKTQPVLVPRANLLTAKTLVSLLEPVSVRTAP